MYDIYYRGSDKYKDACDIGKEEYASCYRALVLFAQLKQGNRRICEPLKGLKEQKIILWGAGDLCKLLVEEFAQCGVIPAFAVDNKVEKFDRQIGRGVRVISVERFNASTYYDHYIVVNDMLRFNDIAKGLLQKGYRMNQIISAEELIAAACL